MRGGKTGLVAMGVGEGGGGSGGTRKVHMGKLVGEVKVLGLFEVRRYDYVLVQVFFRVKELSF